MIPKFQQAALTAQSTDELKTLIADIIALHPVQRPRNWKAVIRFCEITIAQREGREPVMFGGKQ